MSDILLFIVISVVYLVGVIVSMALVAHINRKDEEIPEVLSIFSWVFVLGTFVLLPIFVLVIYPFEKLQNYLNNKFKEK